jgi:hypothetical protein
MMDFLFFIWDLFFGFKDLRLRIIDNGFGKKDLGFSFWN